MRPVGAAVHLYKKTVNLRLVGWMVCGSVPMAFVGAYLLHELGDSSSAQDNVERFLGAALLIGAAAMVFRYYLDRRSGQNRIGVINDVQVRPLPTIGIGMIGGLIVGMTSVGSGSLMIVLLLFLYPLISANALVGTDLTQAVPLTAAAALGALIFGTVEFGVTASIVIGSVPGRADRLVLLLAGAGQVHQADHHLRDLRVRPQVRRRRHHRAGLGPVRRRADRRRLLALPHPAVAQRQRQAGGRHRERSGPGDRGGRRFSGSRLARGHRTGRGPPGSNGQAADGQRANGQQHANGQQPAQHEPSGPPTSG